jgi:hypothetical protein
MSTRNSAAEIQFRLLCTPPPPDAPPSKDCRLPRVTQIMAVAIHLQDMLQRGEARDYADLARLGCLTRERMSQIMELIWLAPDIQKDILEFKPYGATRFPISEVAVRRVAADLGWKEQREAWHKLKQNSRLD